MEDREEELENEEDREEHVYQTLDGREISSIAEQVYAVPLKPKVRFYWKLLSLLCVAKFLSDCWRICALNKNV